MISPPLSGAMEDCSIVLRVQQLLMLYRWRCCMSASQRMFGSMTRRQSSASCDGEMPHSDRWTRASQPWSWHTVEPVASVVDGAPALCGLNVEYQ